MSGGFLLFPGGPTGDALREAYNALVSPDTRYRIELLTQTSASADTGHRPTHGADGCEKRRTARLRGTAPSGVARHR